MSYESRIKSLNSQIQNLQSYICAQKQDSFYEMYLREKSESRALYETLLLKEEEIRSNPHRGIIENLERKLRESLVVCE